MATVLLPAGGGMRGVTRACRIPLGARGAFGHSSGMATDRGTVSFIVDQLSGAPDVSAKPMFGEYGVYSGAKLVALICDGQLFIKPTPGGRAFVPECAEAAPYPGAKPCLLIDPEQWDDRDWLAALVTITAAELPAPRPKAPRKPKRA